MTELILTGEDFHQKKKSLKKIRADSSRWTVFYQDENFGKWVEEYPNSEYHGGGQPQLRLLEKFPWEVKTSKAKYKRDFKIIQNLINEFDPCFLIKSGVPVDEYDDLVNKVLSQFYNYKAIVETRDLIFNEIQNHYGLDIPKEEIENFKFEIERFLLNAFNKIQ